jgi:hypothetical protein
MSTMLTLPQAHEMIAEILLSEPDRRFEWNRDAPVDKQCIYFDPEDNPVCAIGHVFTRIGIAPGELSYLPHNNPNGAKFNVLEALWSDRITPEAAGFLGNVQNMQDQGITWREVYDHFYGGPR